MIVCNFNCLCSREECDFKHNIRTLEERKFASRVFNSIPRIKDHQSELSPETRRANCSYGQLCDKETCGFKHGLDYEFRAKFSAALDQAKMVKRTEVVAVAATSEVATLKAKVASLEVTVAEMSEKLLQLSAIVGKMSIQREVVPSSKAANWAEESG